MTRSTASAGYNLGGRITIELWPGDIAATGAAVIVNSIGSRASFRNPIAQSILAAAGQKIKEDVQRYTLIEAGSVIVTHSGRLADTRYLFHGVVTSAETGYRTTPRLVVRVTTRCVLLADLLDQPTIAMPAFGSGVGRGKREQVVEQMVNALVDVFPECKRLEKIIFATTSKRTFELFNNRVLAVQTLIRREQELKDALQDVPPSLYGLVGSLLQRLEDARQAGHSSKDLLEQAEGIIKLGTELKAHLPQETGALPDAIQLIINTGDTIVQNVTPIAGDVWGPVLSGTFEGPTTVTG